MKRRQIFRAQASKSQTGSSSRRFVNSGPVLPFNPASIPGCQLWLDAADTSSIALNSSSNVLTWIDKGNTGTTATPTRGATGNPINYVIVDTYPGVYINNNNSTVYNSSTYSQLTIQSNFQTTRDYSVFAVVNLLNNSNGAEYQTIYTNERASGAESRSPNFGAGVTLEYISDGTNRSINSSFIGTGRLQTSLTSSTSALTAYKNGTVYASNTSSLTGTSSDSGALPMIGGTYGASYGNNAANSDNRFATGYFHELLVFNSVLTTIQRQKVEGYLAHKWGLQTSLPSNHPHKTIAPTYEEPVFVPTLISGSQLWLDAVDTSSLTLSGSNVTQIRDKSSNAYTFTGSAGTYPTRTTTLNGIPVISSATGQYLRTTTFNQNFLTATVFFVIRPTQDLSTAPTTFPNYTVIRGSVNGVIETGISYWLGKYYPYLFQSGQGFLGGNEIGYNPVNINLLATGIVTGTGATNEFYMNGSLNIRGGENGTFSQLSSQILNCIGHPQNQTSHGYDFAEVILYGYVLTTSQRQRVEGYLAQKWGLQSSLPANHPYKTIAPTGIPRSITSQSLSVLFNSGSLSVPANAALTLGTNNHTFEFWLYQTSRNFYDVPFIYGNTAGNATNNYYMNLGQYTGVLIGNGSPGGWSLNMANGISLPALNTWSHYALVRNGNTFTLYLNGTNVASATLSISIPAQGGVMAIGGLNSGGNTINGYMANFRFVNGTAVYTSNFTPPTSPLTAIPNTQVLLQGLVDRSPNAFTVTSTGGVTLSTSVSPFV
jgi:hypothetical protein